MHDLATGKMALEEVTFDFSPRIAKITPRQYIKRQHEGGNGETEEIQRHGRNQNSARYL